VRAADPLASRR